jgi:hypothetical protein
MHSPQTGRQRGHPEAGYLFEQTLDELHLAPMLAADPAVARWALVCWWAILIVRGDLNPAAGVVMLNG